MKKIRLSLLGAALLIGSIFNHSAIAQNGPCGWDVKETITHPNCFGECTGSILVEPSIVLPSVEYLWSTGDITSSISGLCADEYTVTVTDDKKCSQTYTYSVEDPAQLMVLCVTLTNESAPGAADGSIEASASGGTGAYDYQWQTNPVQNGALLSGLSGGTYTVIVYDDNGCSATTSCDITTDDKKDCDGFRTQTQGGWGQCHQNGNNPGTYLFANFAGAFPGGLTIGCTNTLSLSSAQAVCEFLPSGTKPRALPAGALNDPAQTYRNVLAGQLVAATLNVGFDMYDPNFGSNGGVTLGEMIIASGPFAGMSVGELLVEANNKIGGCASAYKESKLNDALTAVNENYVDGSTDNGFLVCPDDKKDGKIAGVNNSMKINIYPNPTQELTQISIHNNATQLLTIDLYNVSGQKVATLFNSTVVAGSNTVASFNASSFSPGMYFIRTVAGGEVVFNKVIIK